MSKTKKSSQPTRDPEAPGQLLIRRSHRDLDWIRQSATEHGMDFKDFVFAACLQYAKNTRRLIPYVDPQALPTLQHLTTELSRKHEKLGALQATLEQIQRALPQAIPDARNIDAPTAGIEASVREALRQTQEMRSWSRQMMQSIWRALR